MTLDLFTRDVKREYEQDVARLVPIARELLTSAEAKGQDGITANDVRTIAEARGILLASTQQRYLANVLRKTLVAAGLVPVGHTTTPRAGNRGGNLVAKWGRRRVA